MDVGVSLDGDPAMQERRRGGAEQTFAGLSLLESHGIPFTVTTVVTAENAGCLHRLVLALGTYAMARGIGLDLVVQKGAARGCIRLPGPQELARGIARMKKALALVNSGRTHALVIREQQHPGAGGRDSAFCHAAQGTGLAVTPAGDLYPCTQTAYDDHFFLGTLGGTQISGKPGKRPGLDGGMCWKTCLESACPGECPGRLHYNRNCGADLACTLYQALGSRDDLSVRKRRS
jgi:uncharacterized protein